MSAVGRYSLLRRIGVGGMAEVWKAKAVGAAGFAKTVAIKRVLAEHAEQSAMFNQLFIQEAKIAAELSHPNVVHVHDFGQTEQGEYFIAMEFVAGRSLSVLLTRLEERRVRMQLDWALYVTSEACRGLGYAHALCDDSGKPMRIVHRDVSPQNILVSWHGDVKVTDFGIAKAASGLATMTEPTKVMGKIAYMSPEQARGQPVDHRSDLFGLGLVLYEQLAGERFFSGGGAALYMQVLSYSGISESQLAKVPRDVHDILRKALAVNPDERYRHANDMEAALLRNLSAGALVDTRRLMSTVFQSYFAEEIEAEATGDGQAAAAAASGQVPSYATLEPKKEVPSVVEIGAVDLAPIDEPQGPSPLEMAARVAQQSGFGAAMPWESGPGKTPAPMKTPPPLQIPPPPTGKLAWNAPIPGTDGTPAPTPRTPVPTPAPLPAPVPQPVTVPVPDPRVLAAVAAAMAASNPPPEPEPELAEIVPEPFAEEEDSQPPLVAGREESQPPLVAGREDSQPPVVAGVDPFFGVARVPDVPHPEPQPVVVGAPVQRPNATRWKQGARVASLGASADGARAVSADGANVRAWDLSTRREIASLKGHRKEVTAVGVTADASFAISAGREGAIRVWDVRTMRCQHSLEGHTGGATAAAISPDGWFAISGGIDGRVFIWDLVTAKAAAKLAGHAGAVNALVLVDEARAISAGEDGSIQLWDVHEHTSLATLRAGSPIRTLAVVPGGRHAIAGTASGALALLELETLRLASEICATGAAHTALAIEAAGAICASGDVTGHVHLWDVLSSVALGTYAVHESAVTGLAFLDGGKQVLSGSDDRSLALWKPDS